MKRLNFISQLGALLLAVACLLVLFAPRADAVLPSGNGQTTKAHSMSVAIASDQTVPVSGTITATVDTSSLATAANQTTGNTSLSTIATNTTSIATAANQTTANTSLASIKTNTDTLVTNTTSIATAANQTTGNTSLASIKTDVDKIPSQGTAAMAASMPVTIATNDTVAAALQVALNLLTQPKSTTAVTISDSTDTTSYCGKGIWVGTAGDVAVKFLSDSAATTLKNVPSGTFVPGQFLRVMSTNTSASNIVCFGGTG